MTMSAISTRFYALHVLVLPALLLPLIALHGWLAWRRGPAAADAHGGAKPRYASQFVEQQLFRNAVVMLTVVAVIFALSLLRPAELEFTIVLEREPDNAFAHFALARTFERAGRPEQAKRHFRLAAALDPKPEYVKAARFDSEA